MASRKGAVESLAQMADDFFFLYVLTKRNDPENVTIPFLMGHSVEVALKAAGTNLNVKGFKFSHDIRELARQLMPLVPGLFESWPTNKNFVEFKSLYLPGDEDTLAEISSLPDPFTFVSWELAFSVSHVGDLKYGLQRNFRPVSLLHVSNGDSLNYKFVNAFRALRNTYKSTALNNSLASKITTAFPKDPSEAQALLRYVIG